jgi:hypothetical protein
MAIMRICVRFLSARVNNRVIAQAHNLKVVGSNPTPATTLLLCEVFGFRDVLEFPPRHGFSLAPIRPVRQRPIVVRFLPALLPHAVTDGEEIDADEGHLLREKELSLEHAFEVG